MIENYTEYNKYRQAMNNRLLETIDKVIKRIFNVDTNVYLKSS